MSGARENLDFLQVLKNVASLLRRNEMEQAIQKILQAKNEFDISEIVVSPKCDFYLASLFEYFLLHGSPDGINTLFDVMRDKILLQPRAEGESIELAMKAYFKSVGKLALGEKGSKDVSELIAVRQEQFGRDDQISKQLIALLETASQNDLLSDAEYFQKQWRESKIKEFYALIQNIEALLDAHLSSEITSAHVMDAAYYLNQFPETVVSDSRIKMRIYSIIKALSEQPLIEEIVSRMICFERTYSKKEYSAFKPILLELLLNSSCSKLISDRNYADSLEVLGGIVEPHQRIPILARAMSSGQSSGRVSNLSFDSFVQACCEAQIFPKVPFNVPRKRSDQAFCKALLNLAELGLEQSLEECRWLFDEFTAAIDKALREEFATKSRREAMMLHYAAMADTKQEYFNCRTESFWMEPLLLKALSLLKCAKQSEDPLLYNYRSMLACILWETDRQAESLELFDKVSANYDSAIDCPHWLSVLWEKVRSIKGRAWQRHSRNASEVLDLLNPLASKEKVTEAAKMALRTASFGQRKGCNTSVGSCAIVQLSLSTQNINLPVRDLPYSMRILCANPEPPDHCWQEWYQDLVSDLRHAWEPNGPGQAILKLTIAKGGKIAASAFSKLVIGRNEPGDDISEPSLASQYCDQIRIAIDQLLLKRSLWFPDQEAVHKVVAYFRFWSGEFPPARNWYQYGEDLLGKDCLVCHETFIVPVSWYLRRQIFICPACLRDAQDNILIGHQLTLFGAERKCTFCSSINDVYIPPNNALAVCSTCINRQLKLQTDDKGNNYDSNFWKRLGRDKR